MTFALGFDTCSPNGEQTLPDGKASGARKAEFLW